MTDGAKLFDGLWDCCIRVHCLHAYTMEVHESKHCLLHVTQGSTNVNINGQVNNNVHAYLIKGVIEVRCAASCKLYKSK